MMGKESVNGEGRVGGRMERWRVRETWWLGKALRKLEGRLAMKRTGKLRIMEARVGGMSGAVGEGRLG